MNDISGYGLRIQLVASVTFPAGINLTQFADDTDPLDNPSLQIRDKAMGINGDLIVWSKANPIIMNTGVIPGSDDDRNLAVLFEANRTGRGKSGARDVITATVIYPDGSTVSLTDGVITDGMPARGVASAGRLKTNTYAFAFENLVSAG
jgi:hypothetical protein